MKSPLTTLCYIEHDGCYLMMHRVCKENDENQDKWIGIGGHFEEGESPEECLLREAKEETGLTLRSFRFRGLVTFVSDLWGTEYMCLYTAEFPEDSAENADFAEKIPKMGKSAKKGQGKCASETANPERTASEAEENISGLNVSGTGETQKDSSRLNASGTGETQKDSSGLNASGAGECAEQGLESCALGEQKSEGFVTDEGVLEWVPISEIEKLNLWEGDKIFLRLLAENAPFFSLKLRYEGDVLKEAVLDGSPI